ncbi:hypothetical protein TUM12370_21830 [Salmonella enterica subsp. enterica serovar Choleraesuis]|nr:hypothetical protein TUM12370_21830 [Salmonella enterica subsp. enterica serovar Choleraesuis]
MLRMLCTSRMLAISKSSEDETRTLVQCFLKRVHFSVQINPFGSIIASFLERVLLLLAVRVRLLTVLLLPE